MTRRKDLLLRSFFLVVPASTRTEIPLDSAVFEDDRARPHDAGALTSLTVDKYDRTSRLAHSTRFVSSASDGHNERMRWWLVAVCAVGPFGVTGLCLAQEGFLVNPWPASTEAPRDSTPDDATALTPDVTPRHEKLAPPSALPRSNDSKRILATTSTSLDTNVSDARSRELMQTELTSTRDVWLDEPSRDASLTPARSLSAIASSRVTEELSAPFIDVAVPRSSDIDAATWPPTDSLVIAPWH